MFQNFMLTSMLNSKAKSKIVFEFKMALSFCSFSCVFHFCSEIFCAWKFYISFMSGHKPLTPSCDLALLKLNIPVTLKSTVYFEPCLTGHEL